MARLLILYLLLEGERSAYDVKRVLRDPGVGFWFALEDASIYSALKTLARNGCANTTKNGRATTYHITKAGVAEFGACLDRAWASSDEREFRAALAVSPDLTKHQLKQRLEARLQLTESRLERLRAIKSGAMSAQLASHEEHQLEAACQWLRRTLNGDAV